MGHISCKLLIINRLLAAFQVRAISTPPQGVLIIGIENQISSAIEVEKVRKPDLVR